MEGVTGQGRSFAPGFLAENPTSPVLQPVTPLQAQTPPTSFGEEGAISLQPSGSDWLFSAALRYARSNNSKHVDHQTNETHPHSVKYGVPQGTVILTTAAFADTHVQNQESHLVLDFSAGKDVGLGMFGKDGSSVLSLGVRFAQFASKTTFDVRARPDLHIVKSSHPAAHLTKYYVNFHSYHATGVASRSFQGIGPSLSWTGSAPFIGSPQDGEVSFDWGANASILFGNQKSHVQHHETGIFYPTNKGAGAAIPPGTQLYSRSGGHDNARSVTVPNVGGFAGASFRVGNVKMSAGYRADFFFGAVDGGIDLRKSENLGFYGPFATISIGLGG